MRFPDRRNRLHALVLVRERIDTGGAQLVELAPPGRKDVCGFLAQGGGPRYLATSILVIFRCRSPRGVANETSSPRLRPIRALPTGDSLESLASAGSASAEPTIVYFVDFPPSSLTWTTEPTRTTSVPRSDWSITVAERSFSSSEAIRASSIACSFLASSYSAFSEMSP